MEKRCHCNAGKVSFLERGALEGDKQFITDTGGTVFNDKALK